MKIRILLDLSHRQAEHRRLQQLDDEDDANSRSGAEAGEGTGEVLAARRDDGVVPG